MSGLEPASRHYFRLRDQHGTEVLAAERKLGMQGTPNFRDFGGYPTVDGRWVKWGFLFRSGQLSSLSDQDVELLASLKLDLVCDFRRLEEQENDPSRLPANNPPRIASLPIIPGSNSRFFEQAEGQMGDRQAMFDFMLEINRDFAEAQTEAYARMFREILEVEDARFLVHCAAGKDRTGFAAAIILIGAGGFSGGGNARLHAHWTILPSASGNRSVCGKSIRCSRWTHSRSCRCWRFMRIIWLAPYSQLSKVFRQ